MKGILSCAIFCYANIGFSVIDYPIISEEITIAVMSEDKRQLSAFKQ